MSSPTKILVVDDEQDICYFLTTSLSKRGFITSYSNTLAEAEKKIASDTPSILLLDNHLPDGRGVDFVPQIISLYPNMKVIMITAHDTPQDRSKAYDNGVSFFLSKPFTIAAMNQVVDLIVNEERGINSTT